MNQSTASAELVVFDFDGTLAHRPGMWSQCFLDVLDGQRPSHAISIDDLRAQLHNGFPWHDPGTPHTHIRSADDWWLMLGSLIDRVFLAVGVRDDELDALRAGVRSHYCDADRFILYPDVIQAMKELRAARIPVVILSNHVPELPAMTVELGLETYVDDVFTSALIGYEKPHPQSFSIACGATDPGAVWMIGDNPTADKFGAEQAGMNSALVRHPDGGHGDVLAAVRAILASPR